jgi:signal transduction histidine kinase/DNA-binding NarL/FixJ family response regulator
MTLLHKHENHHPYNQWVADQTMEDYALRFTAKSARRFSASTIMSTALGATAFLALEAIGGSITLHYGVTNALYAMLAVSLVIILTGLPISYYATKSGLDIDLLTRGAGFGYLGSTITSLIYATFTFIFFAIEAAIMAMALKALFHIPLGIGYFLCTVAVIPIVAHGISWISRFQVGTQPIWLMLQLTALFAVTYSEMDQFSAWLSFQGIEPSTNQHANSFDIVLFGAASSVLFAMVAQIGEQVDYLRFLPPRSSISARQWWGALLLAGPGWIFPGVLKMILGSFLAWLAFTQGQSFLLSTDPTHMYQLAFTYIVQSPTMALTLAALMVIISQMKINLTNAYAGSIAWSNFFSRLTHRHPGRVVWLIFNVGIALLLMELGMYKTFENILSVFALIAIGWLGSISADLLINKTFGLGPTYIEFKRAHLYDINPVGVGSMILASIVGMLCHLGLFGTYPQALSHFITLSTTFICVPAIALLTQGKYYIAREPDKNNNPHDTCAICENRFEQEDMCSCPAYQIKICSLCCSLDSRCLDSCKPTLTFFSKTKALIAKQFPILITHKMSAKLVSFLIILTSISLITAGLLSLVYQHTLLQSPSFSEPLQDTLLSVFFILLIFFCILSWILLLSHESRVMAQKESNQQTTLLLQEVESHKETDRALQQAKEFAEAANQAKSRYLTGISHELRTPLQSMMGYSQILSKDSRIPHDRQKAVDIILRSGEYLADLIEGLLDISRIEAGHLDLRKNQIDLHEFLHQILQMFQSQTDLHCVNLQHHFPENLPKYVHADEKRLRQILVNLLSNAIKFTQNGTVNFTIKYRSQVAEFIIEDNGIGIANDDIPRIFKPFERITNSKSASVRGTGLGLTIVKLLCEIMGGDIQVSSILGKGSTFTASLLLSKVDNPVIKSLSKTQICGYQGPRKTVMVIDDENTHRELIRDLLEPLGFTVIEAKDGKSCLDYISHTRSDIYLMDMSMPDMNGIEVSQELRRLGITQPIIMVSANAHEENISVNLESAHNAYLIKPLQLMTLQENLSYWLTIDWIYQPLSDSTTNNQFIATQQPKPVPHIPKHKAIPELLSYAELGYARGFCQKLEKLKDDHTFPTELIQHLETLSTRMSYPNIVNLLKKQETSDNER